MNLNINRTWKCWGIFSIGWLVLTEGAFILSEKFRDVDWIMYPSLFIMLLCAAIGPGAIVLLFPPMAKLDGKPWMITKIPIVLGYVVCFLLIRLFSMLFFQLNIL